jgi:hypothetical protein
VPEAISWKDIAIAVMGTAGAIASLLLVFVGYLVAKAETYETDPPKTKYKVAAKIGLIPFFAQAFVIFTSYLWMLHPASARLLQLWSQGFFVAMVLFVVYAILATLLI